MRYSDAIAYNESSVTYVGSVEIRISGLSNPIIVNNLIVNFTNAVDYSNQTAIGFITINSVATGYIVIEADFQQAQAISSAEIINITSAGEVSVVGMDFQQNETISSSEIVNISSACEVSIQY